MADMESVCSITPSIPLRKPFWMFWSIISLSITYCSNRDANILWKIFPRTDVKAMGLTFAGLKESPDLWINDTWAVHHDGGDA